MSMCEIKRNIDGKYELYIDGVRKGTYNTAEKAAFKASKYFKGQDR